MKKHANILAILLAMTTIASMAQIPNNGFENWNVYGNGMVPAGWWSSNDSVSPFGSYFPITQSTDHYPPGVGNYSIRIANNTSLLPDWGAMGITWPGGWEGNNNPSFPVTGHPNSLCGYYKFQPQNNDSMRIFIALYNNGVEVTQATFYDTAGVSAWTSFIIPFPSYASADSARLMLSSFDADAFQINGNSVLYVDNLSFDSLITFAPENYSTAVAINLYPNPASDIVCLAANKKYPDNLQLNFYNTLGVLIKSVALEPDQKQIDINEISNGVYIVAIKSEDLLLNRRIVIQR